MRFLRFALAAASFAAAATAFASPTDPRLNADYTILAQPQPTQAAGKKVEVIEFFMYRCPHCAALEPELEAWAKRQGDNIVLRRVHFPYSGPKDPGAHLYVTLEAMGKAEELAQKIFDAIHKQRIRLDNNEQAIFDFVAKNGVDLAKFKEVWSSFSVLTKMNRLSGIVSTYKVETAPTLIIDGKYVTSPGDIGQANHIADEPTLMKTVPQVLDALVAKAKASKK